MGRSPCCDKIGLKKGPWTPEEDDKLLAYIQEHGHGSWRALPSKAGLQRCGKSCRLRWTNYLRPDIKRGKFTLQEEQTIIQLHALLGNRWSAIASHLPKRTDNEIKNYWNTHLKKRLAKMGIDPVTHKAKTDAAVLSSSTAADGQTKNTANLSHMAQWESARLEAEARLVRQSKLRSNSFQQQLDSPESGGGLNPLDKSAALQTPAAVSPSSLDIFKAWNNGALRKPTKPGTSGSTGDHGGLSFIWLAGELESPTSTVSYSENAPQTTSRRAAGDVSIPFTGNSSGSCGEGEEEWKGLGINPTNMLEYKDEVIENSISSFTSGFHHELTTTSSIENEWTVDAALTMGNHEHHPVSRSGTFVERFTDLLLNNSSADDRSFTEGSTDSDNNNNNSSNGSGEGNDYSEEENKNYWNTILNLVNFSPSDSPVL